MCRRVHAPLNVMIFTCPDKMCERIFYTMGDLRNHSSEAHRSFPIVPSQADPA